MKPRHVGVTLVLLGALLLLAAAGMGYAFIFGAGHDWSSAYVALDGENEPTIWRHHLYSDDEALIRRCDLPIKCRDSLWLALVRGYECEVAP